MGSLFPIPAIGLLCPHCAYNLTGLTKPRCPECGKSFDPVELFEEGAGFKVEVRGSLLRRIFHDLGEEYGGLLHSLATQIDVTLMSAVGVMLQEWMDRTKGPGATAADWGRMLEEIEAERDPLIALPRAPRRLFVDFPMPECGEVCAACDASLTGCVEARCPACGERFDAAALAGPGALVSLPGEAWAAAAGLLQTILEADGIPSVRATYRHWSSITHGVNVFDGAVVRVPRAYFHDAVDRLESERARSSVDPSTEEGKSGEADLMANDWTCPQCGESVPAHFESCWSCGRGRA